MRRLTPAGVAGVACVLAEPAERAALAACLRTASDRPLSLVPGGAPRRARLLLGGRAVDDVLVVDRGEVGVELHLHGSPAVLDLLAEAFGFVAATATTPAQRLRQQAIGVEQLDLALEQEGFDFDRHLAELRRLPPAARTAAVAATIARSRAALALATPRRLVLVGAQNVGKSSLFNRLLFRERVLTGDVPGLTRDPIAEVTTLAGHPYEVVDTAGVGEFRDELEARARKGREEVEKQIGELRELLVTSKEWLALDDRHFRGALSASLRVIGAEPLSPEDTEAAAEDPERARWVVPALDQRAGADPSWAATLDTLRVPRERGEKPWEWRRRAPIRPVVFRDPGTLDDE
ncbi:MAG: 50S ribosome-binding GTPase, partial [Planctomycetes bacterium]|nr:50S ribosome-binding GTPase [Planctomycetota bacterium]